MTVDSWKQDPRLKQMAPEKLDYLTAFADQITRLPKEQILPAFMSMQVDAAQKGIRFSDSETELLVSVLTSGMSPNEKKKLETLRFIAKKLAARFFRPYLSFGKITIFAVQSNSCISSFTCSSGIAMHPSVHVFCGSMPCKKMADPLPGTRSAVL